MPCTTTRRYTELHTHARAYARHAHAQQVHRPLSTVADGKCFPVCRRLILGLRLFRSTAAHMSQQGARRAKAARVHGCVVTRRPVSLEEANQPKMPPGMLLWLDLFAFAPRLLAGAQFEASLKIPP